MPIQIATQNIGALAIDEIPNECPICYHAMEPQQVAAWATGDAGAIPTEVHLVLRCGRRLCSNLFIAYYGGLSQGVRSAGVWNLQKVAPKAPREPSISEEIRALSPQFVKILGQAAAAEVHGLDEIAGVGYRKALEYLVKDYCVAQKPEDAEKIRAKQLGSVIADHVADPAIKECARRAAWLGNDETHYVRKWESKDIKDLKALLDLTVAWIQTNLLTARYLREMPITSVSGA